MRKLYWIIPVVLILATLIYYTTRGDADSNDNQPIKTSVTTGEFVVTVQGTGELRAKNSVKIRGPRMREAGINRTTISRILAEGTVVKKGAWVASLDQSAISDKFDEAQIEIEKIETQLEQIKYDTAIEMSSLRDQLSDLKFDVVEKRLYVEQSQFEAKMIIQQAELALDRIQRDQKQFQKNYILKQKQSQARVAEILTSRRQLLNKLATLNKIREQFDIKAPEDGMLIYKTHWNGEKLAEGGEISAWDPTVAELPDLSSMISRVYVNEVDISKVLVGQDVVVGVDAFPDKKLEGTITKVANVGQQLRNQDAKVFEIVVQINTSDSTLRPSMTTSNSILTRNIEDAISIPLEALIQDSLAYVVMSKNGETFKQEIILGLANEDFICVELGLESSDEIFLFYDGNKNDLDFRRIAQVDKEKALKSLQDKNKAYELAMNEKAKKTSKFDGKTAESSTSMIIFR